MKTLNFFGMVLMTVLLSVGFTACSSDDDDESVGAGLLKNQNICLEVYKDYLDGEVIRSGSMSNDFYYLHADGSVDEGYKWYQLSWELSGNDIMLKFYENNGDDAGTDRIMIQKVYSDYGIVILRQILDREDAGADYRLIRGYIDSDKYKDVDVPNYIYDDWDMN